MARSSSDDAKRVLRLEQWPEADQTQWRLGLLPGDILDGRSYAEGLRPATLRNTVRGYGRWLAVLEDIEPPALRLAPADRVTPARVRAYLATLRAAGNTNNTIKARFWELRSALRILAPDRDFRWINYPAGQSLHALLPTEQRPAALHDIRVLARWGQELMEDALRQPISTTRAVQYRDGLIILVLARRAPRIRSLAESRLERTLTRSGAQYRMAFSRDETKGKRPLDYGLPASVTRWMEHYLEVERPQLLGNQTHDWLWVGQRGGRLDLRGIEGVLRRRSAKRFGDSFGTHAFRKSLATSGMIASPTTPGMIAAVLGNSPAVTEKHYALGGQIEAAAVHQDTLDADRQQTAGLAKHYFR